ncbi:sugar dehydrogenase complex small subunit [Bradyrhizobium quebecense]|uniref:Dehydrogenase n=2 Tax=Bradyrhizobium quebecense TaxID=2748629 RepID=A0ABS3MN76_9BRAD|nr:sugar dehydrogenase complex small subunit [Bradyrhizobium quebecense]UGY00833.1 sorbitol dehydrogenase family protein [Bradyrhizobium quebecense]
MRNATQGSSNTSPEASIDRRVLLRGVAAAGAAVTGSFMPPAPAKAEIWEEGDQQCRPLIQEKAPDYDINDALLLDFMKLSETLTGVKSLDRRLGAQYLERYARNPDLTALLPQLIKSYRDVVASNPDDMVKVIQQKIMQDTTVGPAAEQLIYLWYVSAFFLPVDHAATSRNWLYGSSEQYEQSLLWPLVRGHAPMTRGGDYGYWESPPPPTI